MLRAIASVVVHAMIRNSVKHNRSAQVRMSFLKIPYNIYYCTELHALSS